MQRLKGVLSALGNNASKLVIDLSCRKQGDKWVVAMNKWQTLTDLEVNEGIYVSSVPFDGYLTKGLQIQSSYWNHIAPSF